MSVLIDRFRSMGPRERTTVVLGTLAVVLILAYSIGWQPWQQRLEQLRSQVPAKRATLTWMQEQAKTVAPLAASAAKQKNSSNVPLLTIIEQTAESANIRSFIRRMAPGDDGQVRIWLTEANFDQWLAWLEQIRTRGVEVGAATVNRGRENKVTIRATLQRR